MADPLTISASLAGLVTLADVVFSRIFQYVKGVKEANKDISALSSEVGALYGILNNLRLVACQLEDESFPSTMRAHHLHSCTQTLDKLKEILDKDSTSSTQTQRVELIKRKLHWPFKSSEVKSLVAEIERHKATLGLALSADGMSGLLQALSVQGSIRDTVDEIKLELRQKHEADTRVAMNEKRRRILNSFGEVDPSKNQRMGLKLRQPGTGLWLIDSQEFQSWSQMDGAKLWLYGIPGAGKTILAATVIEEALRISNTSRALAFFYCDYKDSETQEPHLVLGSLIQQIAKQDEQCFEKVQKFCDQRNPEYRDDLGYDTQELRDLFIDISSRFDCTTLIVDGLDECGSKAAEVTELLASVNMLEGDANIKTLFLSRDEVDIREHLKDYSKVAIAARSRDLKLYVAAEIDIRVRKHKLRIKDPSLKGYIMERLEKGAEGIRRKALGDLPPTLNATYERILRRVNRSNKDVQLLVSRTLRWIAYRRSQITTAALCEAAAINLGDTSRDVDSISDEFEILRRCSSLVRKSADDDCLELAHFTVKEFLQQIGPEDSGEFAAFRIGPYHGDMELAKTCLTYLSFDDFNQGNFDSKDVVERRLADFPLRSYAVENWHRHAREHLHDDELLSLTKRFLKPSKPSTLLSWAQDLVYLRRHSALVKEEVKAGFAEASPLHYAAMLALPEICAWLLESGCDVNRGTVFGTPLQCAIMGMKAFDATNYDLEDLHGPNDDPKFKQNVMGILLEAGADPNGCNSLSERSTIRLLGEGAKVDEQCLDLMHEYCRDGFEYPFVATVMDHVKQENILWEHQSQRLSIRLAVDQTQVSKVLETVRSEDERSQLQSLDYGQPLRTAADMGQVEIVSQLLKKPNIDVQAAEKTTGLTAVHCAARRDHLEIVKLLQNHGAQLNATDQNGKAAIHHALDKYSLDCLEFFLREGTQTNPDHNGNCLWHLAAMKGDEKVLGILARYIMPIAGLSELRNKKGWSPLLCAASVASADNVEWLLDAGCNVVDAAGDGSTALHIIADVSTAQDTIARLIGRGCDKNSCDKSGKSPLMIAAQRGDYVIMEELISQGADLGAQDPNGFNVVHFACEGGHVQILQLLEQKYDVGWNDRVSCWINNEWWTGLSPLHLAAKSPRSDVLEYLLDEKVVLDINAVTDGSATALFIAAWLTGREVVSTLLSRGADPIIKFHDGQLPIHIATRLGRTDVIGVFLEYGCDVEVLFDGIDCELLAIKHGHKTAAKMFREYKVQRGRSIPLLAELPKSKGLAHDFVNLPVGSLLSQQPRRPSNDIHIAWESETASPLHIAAFGGLVSIARFLLERGADVNRTDGGYQTPLYYAAARDSTANGDETAMIELLLDFGANLYAVDTYLGTPCTVAASFGRLGPLPVLTARGADLQLRNRWHSTALHCAAAASRSLSVVQSLIMHGSKDGLGCENPEGYSPLSFILSEGSWHELLFILNLAPDTTVYAPHASNPLAAGVANPYMTPTLLKKFLSRLSEPIVSTLLGRRAKVEGTPLYAACTLTRPSQHEDMINTLLEASAGLELEGGDHGTPLMGACAAGRLAAVKILVSKGGKIHYERDGETVSALNKAKHFPDIVRWILVERFTKGPRRILDSIDD
ncbi:MAG: hypothetical protein Q9172_006692 [Xanthocarpia lactea]